MNRSSTLMLICAAFCLQACMGGGSGGTEVGNALTMSLYLPNGAPASNAVARLRTANHVAGSMVAGENNTVTGSDGILQMKNVPAGNWSLEVIKDTQALLISFTTTRDSELDLGHDTLRAQASIIGEAATVPGGARVVVVGTDHQVIAKADGSFRLDSLPAGDQILQVIEGVDSLRSYAAVSPGDTVTADPVASESGVLLLEDFTSDHRTHHHRFAAWSGGGWWSLSHDSKMVVTLKDSVSAIPIETDSSTKSRAVHFSVSVPPSDTAPWLRCLMQVGVTNKGYDLRSVDSLVFMAKGSGIVHVMLHEADSVQALTNPHREITIPQAWTRISIPMDSITYPGITDPQAWRQRVMDISWGFTADGELWLDEVEFIGATRQEIWGR